MIAFFALVMLVSVIGTIFMARRKRTRPALLWFFSLIVSMVVMSSLGHQGDSAQTADELASDISTIAPQRTSEPHALARVTHSAHAIMTSPPLTASDFKPVSSRETASDSSDGGLHSFDTEDAAQVHCPRDTVVWLNTRSGIWHEKGMHWYGNTREGAYVCRQEAAVAGDRDTMNGQ